MASSSSDKRQAVTHQVEALSAVHAYYADKEKKDLKRKLAASEQELAKMKEILFREQDGRVCEQREIVCYSDDGYEHLENIHNKLYKGSNAWQSGMSLSREEVGQLVNSLTHAKNRFLDNKYLMAGTEDEDEDEDEDDGEQAEP